MDSTDPAGLTPKLEKKNQAATSASVKETIEAILVAFILAFIFRTFAVEAFVIPTGSMGPTLLGAHYTFTCPKCGYTFNVNYSTPDGSEDIPAFPKEPLHGEVYCPNCGFQLPDTMTQRPRINYGDRILVLKYLYLHWPGSDGGHYLFHPPRRWDVVVFKSPTSPERWHYTQNFIKRLVGLPGETLMVLDGELYVKAPGSGQFIVQTRPPEVQDALWRIVYDNDYHPVHYQGWRQPWTQKQGEHWAGLENDTMVRQLDFDHPSSSGTIFFDPDANPSKLSFGDWLGYDQQPQQKSSDIAFHQGRNVVNDLKLELNYTRQAGDGALQLKLTKLDDEFITDILRDRVRILHKAIKTDPATQKIVYESPDTQVYGEASLPASDQGPLHIQFANVDYRVSLCINGKEYLHTTPEQYHPNIDDLTSRLLEWNKIFGEDRGIYSGKSLIDRAEEQLHRNPFGLPHVEITADHQTCRIEHLSLWRDIYYTPWDPDPAVGNRLHRANPPGFDDDAGPVTLGSDEYFVMGDNSSVSFDARYWSDPITDEVYENEGLSCDAGRVPGRFLLGKAFFVYWPAGHSISDSLPAVIPNFGEMRFIH